MGYTNFATGKFVRTPTPSERQEEILANLRDMREDGWKQIAGMDYAELDDLDRLIDEACVPYSDVMSDDNQLRYEARQEVRHRRIILNVQQVEARMEAERRQNAMRALLRTLKTSESAITDLAERGSELWGLPLPDAPEKLPDDLDGLTDEDLERIRSEWTGYGDALPHPDLFGHDPVAQMGEDADSMLRFFDKRIRGHGKALREKADKIRRGCAYAEEVRLRIADELALRTRKRADEEDEQRRLSAELPSVVEALEQRIAELEGKAV